MIEMAHNERVIEVRIIPVEVRVEGREGRKGRGGQERRFGGSVAIYCSE